MVVCNRCACEYPSKEGYFYRRSCGRYSTICKVCNRASSALRYENKRDEINKSAREKLKSDPVAYEKKRQSDAESYRKHRESRLESYKEYRRRQDVTAKSKDYFKSLRSRPGFVEKKKKYLREYYHERVKKDPEKLSKKREQSRSYWVKYPEKSLTNLRNRRARVRGADGTHTAQDVAEILLKQDYRCYWCGDDISGGSHTVDHYIPLVKGGSNGPENLVGACRTCNFSKGAKLPEEFKQYLNEHRT